MEGSSKKPLFFFFPGVINYSGVMHRGHKRAKVRDGGEKGKVGDRKQASRRLTATKGCTARRRGLCVVAGPVATALDGGGSTCRKVVFQRRAGVDVVAAVAVQVVDLGDIHQVKSSGAAEGAGDDEMTSEAARRSLRHASAAARDACSRHRMQPRAAIARSGCESKSRCWGTLRRSGLLLHDWPIHGSLSEGARR